MSTEKNMDGGTFGDETIGITSDDLVLKLGQQLIDLINKDKVIAALSKNMKAIGDARVALAGELDKSRADASQVNEDKASLEAQIDRLKKSRGEIKDDHSRAYSALKTKSRETESKLKEQSREQLEAANKLLGQLKADNAKMNQRHADELRVLSDEIVTYKLEIQSLKDKELHSNGASRVVPSKPKKKGRKYTKKADKTTASA